jgi:hypothetical protein
MSLFLKEKEVEPDSRGENSNKYQRDLQTLTRNIDSVK